MGLPFNGDLVPVASGFANLGVDVGVNAQDAFDITELRPFNHIHQVSGVFHDPLLGQSGVLRFSQAAGAFQISVDGGATFSSLSAGAGVDSVGVLGDANLTGDIDLASPSSGFLAIFDTADASPIQFAVDQLGLSGLWNFPTQGFNGSVVNELTDGNGTVAQGSIQLVGASGLLVDIVGQTATISPAYADGLATCYAESFSAATSWTVNHNLNTENVIVFLWNSATAPKRWLIPDGLVVNNANTATVNFNVAQAGQAVVVACPNT
jgi:hypothetical protein